MGNVRRLTRPALPSAVLDPKNNRQKLRNDFISYLSKRELKWRTDELSSNGEAFVKAIVDALWLIDGQHDVFGERNLRIPTCFRSFCGYNVPEMSKHCLLR